MSLHPMTPSEYAALLEAARQPSALGERKAFTCDVDDFDVFHMQRVGAPNSRLAGRIGLCTHSGDEDPGAVVFVSAPEARMIAASLLNLADELDGTTPLNFHPPRFIEDADLDTPGADE